MFRAILFKFSCAFKGILYGSTKDKSIQIQLILGLGTVFFFSFFKLNYIEWIAVFSAIFIVLISEFFNSTIENVCDLYSTDQNVHIKTIKDMSAGAVLIASFYSLIVAFILVLRRVL